MPFLRNLAIGVWGAVGGTVGAVGGFVAGGPVGAVIGAGTGAGLAGAAVADALDKDKPKPAPPRTPTPPPSPCFSDPWRTITWGNNQSALQSVMSYKPQTEGMQIRILLHGPVGAGKSSLINSVNSVIKGRMNRLALADAHGAKSFTKEYKTYKIQKGGPGSFYPFVFNDIMGLEKMEHNGIPVDDIKLALKGHVKDGYRFNPECKLSKNNQFYNHSPTKNDKVHVLVCVVPANTASGMSDIVVQKIREIRMEASDLGIPQVAILTKIDQACPEVKGNVRNVYKSKSVKKKMEEFSAAVGIPMNCIFPVKNYESEINLDIDVNSLILSALRNIIDCGEDYINSQSE